MRSALRLNPVVSYTTFSPLPVPTPKATYLLLRRDLQGGDRRYILCGTFRPRCLNTVSPGTYGNRIPEAPCPVESGLSSPTNTYALAAATETLNGKQRIRYG